MMGAAAGTLIGGCHRIADEPIDYEALRVDACERVCDTMDSCDPDRFEGQEPEDCFDRCMTLMPRLQEENQCGSRQILAFRCVGELNCDEFASYDDAPLDGPTNAPCVAESRRAISCSTHEPFDLEEPTP